MSELSDRWLIHGIFWFSACGSVIYLADHFDLGLAACLGAFIFHAAYAKRRVQEHGGKDRWTQLMIILALFFLGLSGSYLAQTIVFEHLGHGNGNAEEEMDDSVEIIQDEYYLEQLDTDMVSEAVQTWAGAGYYQESDNFVNFVVVDGFTFFVQEDLKRSNTTFVEDVFHEDENAYLTNIDHLVAVNSTVYLAAEAVYTLETTQGPETSQVTAELYSVEAEMGAEAVQISSTVTLEDVGQVRNVIIEDGVIWFMSVEYIWRSDGTADGTQKAVDYFGITEFTERHTHYYYDEEGDYYYTDQELDTEALIAVFTASLPHLLVSIFLFKKRNIKPLIVNIVFGVAILLYYAVAASGMYMAAVIAVVLTLFVEWIAYRCYLRKHEVNPDTKYWFNISLKLFAVLFIHGVILVAAALFIWPIAFELLILIIATIWMKKSFNNQIAVYHVMFVTIALFVGLFGGLGLALGNLIHVELIFANLGAAIGGLLGLKIYQLSRDKCCGGGAAHHAFDDEEEFEVEELETR